MRAAFYAGPDRDDAYAFVLGVAGWMAYGLDDDGRRRAYDALRASIDAHYGGDRHGVVYGSAAWLITARKRSS